MCEKTSLVDSRHLNSFSEHILFILLKHPPAGLSGLCVDWLVVLCFPQAPPPTPTLTTRGSSCWTRSTRTRRCWGTSCRSCRRAPRPQVNTPERIMCHLTVVIAEREMRRISLFHARHHVHVLLTLCGGLVIPHLRKLKGKLIRISDALKCSRSPSCLDC